jgi:hypothetical protein
MKDAGYKVASWIDEMIAAGNKSFYKIENGKNGYVIHAIAVILPSLRGSGMGLHYCDEQLPG